MLDKIFTFLKDNRILVAVKTKLLTKVEEYKEPFKEKVQKYIETKAPEVKEELVEFILAKVELPFYLKPFKGKVKKVVNKNFDKLVEFINGQINKF